ncbi:MAG: hypothetical protein NEHIOOID_00694 [Holosporales bacterium]
MLLFSHVPHRLNDGLLFGSTYGTFIKTLKGGFMDILLIPILNCISLVLGLYQYVIFAYVILGWLEFFKVVNPYSNIVYALHNFLFSLVEPALNHIRRLIPLRLGVDISPLILILGIVFIQTMISRITLKFL